MQHWPVVRLWILAGAVLALLVGALVYLYLQLSAARVALVAAKAELSGSVEEVNKKAIDLSDALYLAEQQIAAIQSRVGGFEETVGNISGTVGTLEKLSKTDPELLQKYSKVFFLNEHYAPERLSQIEKAYTYDEDRIEKVLTSVLGPLEDMLNEAKDDGVEMYVKSSYRSFNEQSALKNAYSVTYGAGSANQFSADQGYSEHQLGTTVDLITTGLGGQLAGFEKTKAYQWLLDNAYKYGFVLSYPANNGYYIFEPWHWRYVGVKLATYLHNRNKNFYDLEQRQIDEYLGNIFD